jgi:hypothetical protein
MKEKKSFLLHIDSLDILEKLSDEQAGKLFKAIASHHNGSDYELDDLLDLVFTPFKNQFNRDLEKYKKVSEKRALAGKKGGKQKQANVANVANASKCKQNLANLADSDNESDNESDSDKDINTLDQSKIARAQLEEDSFEYWWKEYPKKVAKQSAFKSWKKVIKKMNDETVTELTNHIVNDVKLRLDDLATGSDKFIGFDRLHPTTYLNQERYNDDI